MISERQLARGFQQLWREVLPLLTPHFVHLFNEAYCKPLLQTDGTPAPIVRSGDETNPSLVAEFAFHLVRLAHERSIPLSNVSNDKQLLSDSERVALRLIQKYENRIEAPSPVSSVELSESLLLVENYSIFLADRSKLPIEFSPNIPGAGFVDQCRGDLSISTTLFEIKTMNRKIASKDIRQLLVYLALQAATGTRRWSEAGFFNPRRGLVYQFSVDRMIPLMSGGLLTSEVFDAMVEYFGTRDLQLDSAF